MREPKEQAARAADHRSAGQGERHSFRLVGFGGTMHIVAHADIPKPHHVGKYGVDVAVLDGAAKLLRSDSRAGGYLVDDTGNMKRLSECFVAAMRLLISGRIPIVATVGAHGAFIAEVKRRPECELWQVTDANRGELPSRILAWLAATS